MKINKHDGEVDDAVYLCVPNSAAIHSSITNTLNADASRDIVRGRSGDFHTL